VARVYVGLPRKLILTVDDLPSGYLPQNGSSREVTNDLLVQNAKDKAATAKDVKERQRISGWEARFNNTNSPSKQLPQAVYAEVVVFQTAKGASSSLNEELDPDEYVVSAQRLGDESIVHGSSYQSNGALFAYYRVLFRIGNVLGVVQTYGPVSTEELGPAHDIARKLANRIEAAEWVDASTAKPIPTVILRPTFATTEKTIGPMSDAGRESTFSMSIAATNVEWRDSAGSVSPKPNNVFLAVNVTAKNLGPGTVRNFGQSSFQALDANGVVHDAIFLLGAPDSCQLENVDLLVNGVISGCVAFEIPASGRIDLIYAPYQYEGLKPGRYLSINVRP